MSRRFPSAAGRAGRAARGARAACWRRMSALALTQPPFAVSAMDGYAVRAADVASAPARLKIVG